ncbi:MULTISPECIES: S8 family peptidase [Saccharothrix]|uniref:S8 family peptidase n=1 Tax=Saccharothrix TaxID=2071 RepID=UPI00093AB0D7|nr:S8 family peptidase [Saccharothrix sp. CB00851]OKI31991.1 peptidase S8 [Saccharothrix sp. CB00851]
MRSRPSKTSAAALATGTLVIAAVTAFTPTAAAAPATGDVLTVAGAEAVPNSYVVVLNDGVAATSVVDAHGGRIDDVWRHALNGFAVTATPEQAAKIAGDPRVAFVQQDVEVTATATQSPTPSWGLDRVDQRNLPLDNSYTYPNTAGNVTAYIIDTGIRTTHQDFGGRAVWGTNTSGDGNNSDCNGHGTHVAGTVGGAAHGVAKGVRLVAVKVLNCAGSGTTAGVIAGVDWVTANRTGPAVANMSLGGGAQAALDTAVANSIASGITYAVASGNSNADACGFSPARVPTALTVNASDRNDARATFSNWGACTDLYAPGVGITSAWSTGDTATNTISGTSMAAPHVAGVAALHLSANPGATPAQVDAAITNSATPNVIQNPGTGSPNRLLHVENGGTQPPAKATLNRYRRGNDHASATSAPAGHTLEGPIGTVNTAAGAGTHPIYQCLVNGWDYMTSPAANCEGTAVVGVIGYLLDAPASGANHPIYRCRVASNGNHFDSSAANCEGYTVEGVLGYSF